LGGPQVTCPWVSPPGHPGRDTGQAAGTHSVALSARAGKG
jgi:hypothetical protein